jgi:hypothetical protein
MSDAELRTLAVYLAPLVVAQMGHPRPAAPEPLPHKLTVEQFAWCIERSAYYVNEQTRINPKLRPYVQGSRPKLIHPAALALFGVDGAHAATRLALLEHKSAA